MAVWESQAWEFIPGRFDQERDFGMVGLAVISECESMHGAGIAGSGGTLLALGLLPWKVSGRCLLAGGGGGPLPACERGRGGGPLPAGARGRGVCACVKSRTLRNFEAPLRGTRSRAKSCPPSVMVNDSCAENAVGA